MPRREEIRLAIIVTNSLFWLVILLAFDAGLTGFTPSSYLDMVRVSFLLPLLSALFSAQSAIGAYFRKAVKSLVVVLLFGFIAYVLASVSRLAVSPVLLTDWDIYLAIIAILVYPGIEMLWEYTNSVPWKGSIIAPFWKDWQQDDGVWKRH